MKRAVSDRWLRGWTLAVVVAAACAFWLPALAATRGVWPAPLDDVYIYFGHARSTALGAPLSWFPGNGYSSGATSMVYPWLLAPAWAIGFRGSALGIAASLLALVCVFDACRSLCVVMRGPARWCAAPLVAGLPLLGWSLWSGMETALWLMLLGRTLRAAHMGWSASPASRRGWQWRAGGWLALMAITRPETMVLAMALSIAVVHGAGALGTLSSLARVGGPMTATLALQALCNRWQTGEWAQAGAVRKLIASAPDITAAQAAIAYLQNAIVIASQALWRALGGGVGWLVLSALMALGLWRPAHRRLSLALCAGALGGVALVCLNATARFQNYRYAAPMLAMLACAAALGLDALVGRRRRGWLVFGVVLCAAWLRGLPAQTRHFARASDNIVSQQVEVARRVAALRPRRVLVNDAGAIPYLSEVPPIDGLGLGGFGGLPFARASVQGTGAVVELIERLPASERPDVMALYPGWWGGVVEVFGRRIDSVRITHNVICAADEKVIYAADWSLLDDGDEPDTIDVGDIVDERAHGMWADTRVESALLDDGGDALWDAGRPLGELSFVAWRAGQTLRVRLDDRAEGILRVTVPSGLHSVKLPPGEQGRWRYAEIAVEIAQRDRVVVEAVSAKLVAYQLWLR